jgi:hypothetical protein
MLTTKVKDGIMNSMAKNNLKVGDLVRERTTSAWGVVLRLSKTGHKTMSALVHYRASPLLTSVTRTKEGLKTTIEDTPATRWEDTRDLVLISSNYMENEE